VSVKVTDASGNAVDATVDASGNFHDAAGHALTVAPAKKVIHINWS